MATPPPKNPDPPKDGKSAAAPGEGGQEMFLRLMNEQLVGWRDPRAMLEKALEHDHFLLLTQKILPLKPGAVEPLCYEVLLRLMQEETNLLPPGGFFPIAESLGMMGAIDRWVVRHVIAWGAARLKKKPPLPLPMMCVNISAETFDDRSFSAYVLEQLKEFQLPPRALCFELNEMDIVEYRRKAQEFIVAVRPGSRITIDAFGSVKVSFSHLAGLPIDFIKIDGTITQNILREPAELAKVRAINAASQKLGVRTIVEFVETREMLDKLREIGVDYVQGFGIARPAPITTLP